MNTNEMKRLTSHYDRCFQQSDPLVFHPIAMEPHIDVMKYPPSEAYPFWKLVTMGASDHRMPGKNPLADRNEYMMFIPPEEDLDDQHVFRWYYKHLIEVAMYPVVTGTMVTYGHSMEWEPEEDGPDAMTGAFLEMPQAIEDVSLLRCRLGLRKTAACLQVVLLTRSEVDRLLDIGPQDFSEYLYPEEDGDCHFLCERKRTARF